MIETWKDIPGYEGVYMISSVGRVKRLSGFRCKKDRILKVNQNTGGYSFIELCKDRIKKTYRINRLVLMAFDRMPKDGEVACHYPDTNKLNNNINNLRWDTVAGNVADQVAMGHTARGTKNGLSVLDDSKVLEIKRLLADEVSQYRIAEIYGVSRTAITAINCKKNWAWL
jgi:hypothetical protein